MKFVETGLKDAYLIQPEKRGDERGFFARAWCEREFSDMGLETRIAQANMSRSADLGTLRGMHLQMPPDAETKIIRCTAGAVYDVIIEGVSLISNYRSSYQEIVKRDGFDGLLAQMEEKIRELKSAPAEAG